MNNFKIIETVDNNCEELVKIFKDVKSKTTSGKLRSHENHVYINNQHVITAAGRFVNEEEQKANLDLWILVKDTNLVENLLQLKILYKNQSIKLAKLCIILILLVLMLICLICFLLIKN